MIGTSLPEYIFIRICIFALRAITPLSIFYVAFSIGDPPSSVAGKLLLTWCAIETAFWLLVYFPRKRNLQRAAQHPPILDREGRKELFWRCWDKIPNPEYYVSKWFLDAKPQDIKRENVKDFFRWALLNKGDMVGEVKAEEVELLESEEEELNEYADGIQTLLCRSLAPGRGKAECLRLTLDKVNMCHRPVVWYMIVGLVDTLTAIYLRYKGFHLRRTSHFFTLTTFPLRLANFFTRNVSPAPEMSYWYRPHTSKTRLPIVFIHGISIGLYSYSQFLAAINDHDPLSPTDGSIGIIALEILPISFRLTRNPIACREELCRQINAILEFHGWDKVVLASHSYGSVITTHLLQNAEANARIGPMLFIDPVTFLLHLPDVCYNFTARQPRRANEAQLAYFASTDMMVANALARHFFWADNILWKEDLDLQKRNVTVSLAGRDLIVPSEIVGRYVAGKDLEAEDQSWKERVWTGKGLETLWWPTCDHAQVFEREEGRRRLGAVLRGYVKQRDGEDEDEE